MRRRRSGCSSFACRTTSRPSSRSLRRWACRSWRRTRSSCATASTAARCTTRVARSTTARLGPSNPRERSLDRSEAEHGPARVEAVDAYRGMALPLVPRQSQAVGDDGLVASGVDRDAVGLVAELAGYALRGMVVLEHLGERGLGAEVVEGQAEQTGPRLR